MSSTPSSAAQRPSIRTVGVIGKRTDPAALPTLAALCVLLQQLGCEVLVVPSPEGGRS